MTRTLSLIKAEAAPDYRRLPRGSSARVESRFFQYVEQEGDCWSWVGRRNDEGYGLFTFASRRVKAHRMAYELLVGTIRDGLVLDHLCQRRECVNPDHLDPVTPSENSRRRMDGTRLRCVHGTGHSKTCVECQSDYRLMRSLYTKIGRDLIELGAADRSDVEKAIALCQAFKPTLRKVTA